MPSNYTSAYYNRGFAKYKSGDTKEAEEDYKKACELKPEYKNKPYE